MTKKILKGIEAYKKQQERIIQLIKDHGGELTSDEFDKEFSDFIDEIQPDGNTVRKMKKPSINVWPMNINSFILGSLRQPGDWSKWVHLTQLMCQAKILTAKNTEKGTVVYRIRDDQRNEIHSQSDS